MRIIGITGAEGAIAGSGKDAAAEILVERHGYVRVAIADVMKRYVRELFGFTEEQLWGGSEHRNAEDKRYVRLRRGALGRTITEWNPARETYDTVPSPPEDVHLSPRHALQRLGSEWGRDCYEDVWIEYALRVASELLADQAPLGRRVYAPQTGLHHPIHASPPKDPPAGIVIPDVRYDNEARAIHAAGGIVVRVVRPGAGLEGVAGEHRSERGVSDEYIDALIENAGTLEDLATSMAAIEFVRSERA